MNLSNLLTALIQPGSDGRLGRYLQAVYFAIWYNTTSTVNTILALGSVTPYALYLADHHQLTLPNLSIAVLATLLSAYCYGLVYVINDWIDRRKDEALGIPKFTARHVLGRSYLTVYGAVYGLIAGLLGVAWPHALAAFLGYSLVLAVLSVIHSHWRRVKALTIFIERMLKFASPLWLTYIITGNPHAATCLIGALMAYPLGFTMDYAYRGYVRDRLKRPASWRFILYGLYWAAVITGVATTYHYQLLPLAEPVEFYLLWYVAIMGVATALAHRLPLAFLDHHYEPAVALEKRRLLSYGLTQIIILTGGLLYVISA